MAPLRGAQQTLVTARVGVLPDLAMDGVSVLEVDGDRLRLTITAAALPEVLQRLAAAGVHNLETGAPSLEDVFLAHYQQTEV